MYMYETLKIVFDVDGWFWIGSLLCAKSPWKNVGYHLGARILVLSDATIYQLATVFFLVFCFVVDYSSDWV
jgi:hypothetical protein